MPAAADVVVLTVRVELVPAVIVVGEKVAVTPLGAPDTASVTEPADPEVTAVDIVAAEFAPGAMLSVEGDALILKSLAATPPTEIAALVPLNPVFTVPVALIV